MLKSLFTVGGWTLISRILGFLRDILIALILGAGPVAEAFFVAFRLPNMFRRIFAEGAYAAAFVPLLTGHMQSGSDKAADFAAQAQAWLSLVLLILSTVALVFMGPLVDLLAPGFGADAAKRDLTILLGRITFAYLFAMALTAHFSGILNALGKFAAAAAAPVLLNLFFIAGLLIVLPLTGQPGMVLAWSAFFAGIAQVVLVVLAVKRTGFSVRAELPRRSRDMGKLLRLMLPGTISAGVQQINLLVGTRLVSAITGAVAYLNYADRVYQLPLGLIGIAFGIVLLPSLSRLIRSGDEASANSQLNRGMEFALLLTLPAAAALATIALPIITALFERGQFTASDSLATAQALVAYAAGLPAFVVIKVLLPGFFAREDTRSPMIYAMISMAANVALALLLIGPLGFVGVALASSLAAWLNITCLAIGLVRRGHWRPDQRLLSRSLRIAAASAVMGGALLLITPLVTLLPALFALIVLVISGGGLFTITAVALRAARPSDLRAAFNK